MEYRPIIIGINSRGGRRMKPIIFSTAMVRESIDGRKTQTRRVIKPQPLSSNDDTAAHNNLIFFKDWPHKVICQSVDGKYVVSKYEQYKKGQILWVRETWNSVGLDNYVYRADYDNDFHQKWKPSIFMPRKAARLFLRVKRVGVEKIQEIATDDIIAEGIRDVPHNKYRDPILRKSFSGLWDLINKKRGYGWDVDPWVWVIEFESCSLPELPGCFNDF